VRQDDLIIEDLGDSFLVYDSRDHVAHALDGDAAIVWRHLHGRLSLVQVAERCELSEAVVNEVVARFEALGLLAEAGPGGMSRRAAIRRAAKLGATAAVAAPLAITTIAVPSALASASTDCGAGGAGQTCSALFSDSACTDKTFDACKAPFGNGCSCILTGACASTGHGGWFRPGICG
jgi:hypothetical protein